MNKQEQFDVMVKHLRKQGQRSVNIDEDCRYRGPSGLKCAVGALIPDGMYDEDMEGHPVEDVLEKYPELSIDRELAIYMQKVHDTHPVSEWEEGFERAARAYNLKVPDHA